MKLNFKILNKVKEVDWKRYSSKVLGFMRLQTESVLDTIVRTNDTDGISTRADLWFFILTLFEYFLIASYIIKWFFWNSVAMAMLVFGVLTGAIWFPFKSLLTRRYIGCRFRPDWEEIQEKYNPYFRTLIMIVTMLSDDSASQLRAPDEEKTGE